MKPVKKLTRSLLLICLLTVLVIELILHGFTSVLSDHRVTDPTVSAEDRNLIRIVALGESTTDPVFARLQKAISWPEQLENLLNKNGRKYKVYNLGRSSVNTFYFASRIDQLIQVYKPAMIISMIGINDNKYHSSFEKAKQSRSFVLNLLDQIKIYQFFTWYNHLYQFEWNSLHFGEGNEKLLHDLFMLQEANSSFSFENLLQALHDQKLSQSDQNFFLTLFTYKVLVNSNKSPKNTDLVSQIFQFLDEKKYFSRDLELSKIYYFALLREEEKCFNFVESLVLNHNRTFSETEMGFVLGCVKGNPTLAEKWISLLNPQKHFTNISLSQHSTFQNYTYLIKQAESQKIKYLAMQYPLRSIAELENLYKKLNASQLFFVENTLNFKKTLLHQSYSDVFTDRMAYDFGHLTTLGHSLIAENLFEVVPAAFKQ